MTTSKQFQESDVWVTYAQKHVLNSTNNRKLHEMIMFFETPVRCDIQVYQLNYSIVSMWTIKRAWNKINIMHCLTLQQVAKVYTDHSSDSHQDKH